MSGLPLDRLRCCICGRVVSGDEDYVQLELRVDRSGARQTFGAHRNHLQSLLAPGFTVEVEPEES